MARPLGLGYVVFAGVIGALGGLYIFAPQIPRGWFSAPARPTDEGPMPVLPGDMQVNLEARDHEAALATTVRVAAPRKAAPVATVITAPVVTAAPKLPNADAKGQALLTEADAAYHVYQWDKAMSSARKVLDLEVSPAVRLRAKDIVTQAPVVAQLFQKLNDRDELSRNYDTNPSLVGMTSGGKTIFAVPIQGTDKDSPVIDKDPLGFIATQRKLGQVSFLVQGNKGFIAAPLADEKIGTVALVDQVALRKDRRTQLDAFRKTLVGAEARDPMAWYDLGRFAFQNRLDDQVVDALHRAVLLDPKLSQTVREDRASVLYANLISHMKNSNKMQAAIYMGLIDRKYKDTEQGRQARLYYDGKTEEMLAAAKEIQRKASEEETRRLDDLKKRAAESGDVAMIKVAEEDPPEAAPTITGSPDESKALALYEQGAKFCSDAIDKGNTPERDRLYGEAIKVLQQAVPMLSKLAENEKDAQKRQSLEVKVQEANQMKLGAIKMRRPGH